MTDPVPCKVSKSLFHPFRCDCENPVGPREPESVTLEIHSSVMGQAASFDSNGHGPSCDPGDCSGCGG